MEILKTSTLCRFGNALMGIRIKYGLYEHSFCGQCHDFVSLHPCTVERTDSSPESSGNIG